MDIHSRQYPPQAQSICTGFLLTFSPNADPSRLHLHNSDPNYYNLPDPVPMSSGPRAFSAAVRLPYLPDEHPTTKPRHSPASFLIGGSTVKYHDTTNIHLDDEGYHPCIFTTYTRVINLQTRRAIISTPLYTHNIQDYKVSLRFCTELRVHFFSLIISNLYQLCYWYKLDAAYNVPCYTYIMALHLNLVGFRFLVSPCLMKSNRSRQRYYVVGRNTSAA